MEKMSRAKGARMTQADLCALAPHIRYEADMLHIAYKATQSPPPQPQASIVLECFLLHWRNLWYFLLERKKGDVIASDYIASWKPHRPSPDFRKRVHTLLAHLSKLRLGQRGFSEVDVRVMHDQIAKLWTEFYRQLPSDDERAWFKNPLEQFPVKYRGPESPLLLK